MTPEELASQEQGFAAIAELIEASSTIAICAHTSPDGDALGSQLGLAHIIATRWPEKDVTCLLADPDPVPRIYAFLPWSETLVHVGDYDVDPDLFICVDLSIPHRLNEAADVIARSSRVAIIDHHPNSSPVADAYVIRPDAAAAGILVAHFACWLGLDIDARLAKCLYCAITTDTGRFQYQNSNPEAFAVASMLVDAGAEPTEVSLNVYQSFRLEYLHLLAVVCGRTKTFDQGRIAYSYATLADFERTGATHDESDGLIDMVRAVDGTQVALFLKEVAGGKVRGNLRSKGSADVSLVARAAGGGGHKAAAGFTFEGDVDEACSAILPMLRKLLAGDLSFVGEDGK